MNLVIGGYTFGGSGQPFESLLLGAFDGQRLRYAGLVGGWSAKGDPDLLYRMISNRHVAECPFTEKLQFDRFFYWCEPRWPSKSSTANAPLTGRLGSWW